jgi:hypothetical protein
VPEQPTQPVVDLVLTVLVRAVNKGETSNLGVSLLVGGSWVTGSMIGGRMWFDQLAQLVDSETGGDGGQLFHRIGETAYPSESERLAAGKTPLDSDPGFVHLQRARLLTGAAVRVPDPGGLVRIKLSSIDGWMIGILDPRVHGRLTGPPGEGIEAGKGIEGGEAADGAGAPGDGTPGGAGDGTPGGAGDGTPGGAGDGTPGG